MKHLIISFLGCLSTYGLSDKLSDSTFRGVVLPLLFLVFTLYFLFVVIFKIRGLFGVQKMTEGERRVAPYIKNISEAIRQEIKYRNRND